PANGVACLCACVGQAGSLRAGWQPALAHLPYETRQIILLPSSDTSRLPSAICNNPTGRPQTSFLSSPSIQPVTKSSGSPAGLPFLNGINTTEYPNRLVRLDDPRYARKAPLAYFFGNCWPV